MKIEKIKSLIYRKNRAFEKFCCNRSNRFIKRQLNVLQDHIITLIETSKQEYYCRMTNKLINTQLLKGFLNNKKIHLIPALFHKNCSIADFKEKAEIFSSFVAKQCSQIRNDSELPTSLTFYTNNRLSTVSFSHEDLGKIIENLNPNKAHGHNNISMCILKYLVQLFTDH